MNESSNDFIVGTNTNADVAEDETVEPQADGIVNDFGRSTVGENSASPNEVTERNSADKIGKEIDSAVTAIKNRVHDAILTAMDDVVIPRVKMAVRSIIGSSGRGWNSVVQNLDQRDCSGNMENTPLMTASSRTDKLKY